MWNYFHHFRCYSLCIDMLMIHSKMSLMLVVSQIKVIKNRKRMEVHRMKEQVAQSLKTSHEEMALIQVSGCDNKHTMMFYN